MSISILFVCMGNICRSPAAEGVMGNLITKNKLQDKIRIDSAGTAGHHVGELADARMREHSQRRNLQLVTRSRKFIAPEDFKIFDYIIIMDEANKRDLEVLDPTNHYSDKVHMLCDFCENFDDKVVPDPYYGGDQGFEHVLDLVEDGCQGLLKKVLKDHL
jgi:protein-tyrosine phosphatase